MSDWIKTNLSNNLYFEIQGSGINKFNGEKIYLSTSSIQGKKIVSNEGLISYKKRPSRANIQPIIGNVYFAKMRYTHKIILGNNDLFENNILSTGFLGLSTNQSPRFLEQYITSIYFNNQKDLYAEGTTQEAISNGDLEKITISFPQDIKEQEKIADILGSVDDLIEKTDQVIGKYKNIKTGLMNDLFTKGINVETGKPHTEFRDSELGRIPKEWEVVRLGEVVNIKTGPFGSQIKIEDRVDNGYRVYNQKSVINNDLDIDKFYINKNKFLALSTFKINENDIVITSRGTIGKLMIFPKGAEEGILHPCLIKMTCENKQIHYKYLYHLFKTNHLINQLTLQNNITTIGVIYGGNLAPINIQLPLIKEQEKIADILSEVDNKIFKEEEYKEKLLSLKKGLMNDLLSGKVRVEV